MQSCQPRTATRETPSWPWQVAHSAIARAAAEGLPTPALIDYLLREVDAFCGPVEQHDDHTIVVLEVAL